MSLILVVDDVKAMAEAYAYDLARVGGYETLVADGGKAALEILESEPVDCTILDLEMPGLDGFDVLKQTKERGIAVPVIVYTGTGDFDRCAEAIRLGAESFIDKAEPIERVVREVEHALERRRLRGELDSLKGRLASESTLIGDSQAMCELKAAIARIAPVPSAVLVLGESGSGKELVARELHRLGASPSGPFIAINCAALPENLVESELFGHERGAFTGASRMRKGAFESASGGTLFLDEIGELPIAAQAKLLRVLEERKVTRLGGARSLQVDARVVAATQKDLEHEVEAGRFRQDLLYRLNPHQLIVPPLRDRLSDVPKLADHLVKLTCARFGTAGKKLTPEALAALMRYDWRKNNVRELRNAVERMVIASSSDLIEERDVPADILGGAGSRVLFEAGKTFQDLKAEAERQIVLVTLERHDWHVTNAAQALGLADHSSLLKIMRRHGIRKPN